MPTSEIKKHPLHPLAIARDKWLESPEGQRCVDFVTLTRGPFLENRLVLAFQAGLMAHEVVYKAELTAMRAALDVIVKWRKNCLETGVDPGLGEVLMAVDGYIEQENL